MLRRLLLAAITALVVARPLVLGEDPGLLNRLSSAWSLVLSLLWLLTAVGWAVWRAWSGQSRWRGSAVEGGLAAVAALMWVSAAGVAHYKHPAFLIASEWSVLVGVFCLVRQLARTPEDDRGLLAALLASAVSLSAFALYQYTVIFPEMRRTYGSDLHALLDAMAAENVVANPDLLQRRLSEDNVFGSFSHPNSFAGFLALLFPLSIAWTFTAMTACSGQRRAPSAIPGPHRHQHSPLGTLTLLVLAAASTLLIGLALWLTHSRGAILGSLFVGVVLLMVYGRRFLASHKAAWLTGMVGLVVLGAAIFHTAWMARGLTKFWESSSKRNDYWIATWAMIRDHPWLGVGPGNFGRLYTSYMLPRAYEQIKDPHNFILEVWVTGGVFALLAVLFTLALFFRRAWRGLVEAGRREERENVSEQANAIRWEFYLGGLMGLILGFVLRAMTQSADEILLEGFFAACRSIIWFTAFAFFCKIPISATARFVALVAGVGALLVNLLFSGGIAMPSVAQPLWIMVALGLNSLGAATPEGARSVSWPRRLLPFPVLACTGLAYYLLLCYPAIDCESALDVAREHYVRWRVIIGNLTEEVPQPQRLQAASRAGYFLETTILKPVEKAVEADPGNSLAWLELAEWYGELCKVSLTPDQMERVSRKAIACAEQAQSLDPDNKEPFLFKHKLHRMLAERFKEREKEEYGYAADAMRAAVERDPTDARLRYQLVKALFLADLSEDGRRQAKTARELDEQATRPERQLTASQREQLKSWLATKD